MRNFNSIKNHLCKFLIHETQLNIFLHIGSSADYHNWYPMRTTFQGRWDDEDPSQSLKFSQRGGPTNHSASYPSLPWRRGMVEDCWRLLLRRRLNNPNRWSSVHYRCCGLAIIKKFHLQILDCRSCLPIQMVEPGQRNPKKQNENTLCKWPNWVLEWRLVHVWWGCSLLRRCHRPNDHWPQMA